MVNYFMLSKDCLCVSDLARYFKSLWLFYTISLVQGVFVLLLSIYQGSSIFFNLPKQRVQYEKITGRKNDRVTDYLCCIRSTGCRLSSFQYVDNICCCSGVQNLVSGHRFQWRGYENTLSCCSGQSSLQEITSLANVLFFYLPQQKGHLSLKTKRQCSNEGIRLVSSTQHLLPSYRIMNEHEQRVRTQENLPSLYEASGSFERSFVTVLLTRDHPFVRAHVKKAENGLFTG